MSKVGITVLVVAGDALAIAGVVMQGQSSGASNGTQPGVGGSILLGFGCLLALFAYVLALREAWWQREWLWLIGVFITSIWIGPLIWGMFGPGMLAPLAKQKLNAMQRGVLTPQMAGIQAPAWTPELVKYYLEREGFTVQEGTLYRTLRRMRWLAV